MKSGNSGYVKAIEDEVTMATKQIHIYVILGIALLLSSGLLAKNAHAARDGTISFISEHEGTSELYLIDSTDRNLQKLISNNGKTGSGHTWSPDGRFFAYVSREKGKTTIRVMDTRNKESRPLIDHPSRNGSPAWSPNGKWIAFISNRTEDWQIYRVDVDGSNLKQLTNRGNNSSPAWSSNSQWIAFDSYQGGHGAGVHGRNFLYIMTADGGRSKRLIEGINISGCTWSPNGKQIAFAAGSLGIDGMNIFTVDADGNNLRKRTDVGKDALALYPAWSPDGTWLAYSFKEVVRWPGPGERLPVAEFFGDGAIYIVSVVGNGAPVEIIDGLSQDATPEWVPENFFPVAPSTEKQTTLWSRLKKGIR